MTGWDSGSTRAWRKVRRDVLDRDNHTCRLNLEGCKHRATQVHHLDGKQHGDNPDRMVAACWPCNRKVGEPTKDPEPTPGTQWE